MILSRTYFKTILRTGSSPPLTPTNPALATLRSLPAAATASFLTGFSSSTLVSSLFYNSKFSLVYISYFLLKPNLYLMQSWFPCLEQSAVQAAGAKIT